MTPLNAALVRAVVFLLSRYALTGWVPNGEPERRRDNDTRDCECTACHYRREIEREAA